MYRVISITPLSNGLKYGDLFGERDDMNIPALLAAGRIAEAQSPPIGAVPKLANIARRLTDTDIKTVQQFIDADAAELAEQLGYKTKAPVERYQTIAANALRAPEVKKNG